MTRTRKKIHKAAAEYGLTIDRLEYEALGPSLEMAGPSGGWSAWLKDEDGLHCGVAAGYNASDLIQDITYNAQCRGIQPTAAREG